MTHLSCARRGKLAACRVGEISAVARNWDAKRLAEKRNAPASLEVKSVSSVCVPRCPKSESSCMFFSKKKVNTSLGFLLCKKDRKSVV